MAAVTASTEQGAGPTDVAFVASSGGPGGPFGATTARPEFYGDGNYSIC